MKKNIKALVLERTRLGKDKPRKVIKPGTREDIENFMRLHKNDIK